MVTELNFRTDNHNASFMQWVDDDSVAFSPPGGVNGAIYVVNVDTGTVEHGPYKGGFLGDNNHGGKILMSIRYPKSNLGDRGVYELDTNTGKVRQIFKASDFVQYYDKYKWKGDRDYTKWKIAHVKYSTDGSLIAFVVIPPGEGRKYNLFTCKPDGSDLVYWGGDKPMHYSWFDHNTIFGSDSEVKDGNSDNNYIKRWSRNKEYIETLAGFGCHVAMSPDKQWFAGETWYKSNPIKLFIYKRASEVPAEVIFEHSFADMVWKYGGHVNPSFSRDGKRLYYTRAVSNQLKQAYYCDISSVVECGSGN